MDLLIRIKYGPETSGKYVVDALIVKFTNMKVFYEAIIDKYGRKYNVNNHKLRKKIEKS